MKSSLTKRLLLFFVVFVFLLVPLQSVFSYSKPDIKLIGFEWMSDSVSEGDKLVFLPIENRLKISMSLFSYT